MLNRNGAFGIALVVLLLSSSASGAPGDRPLDRWNLFSPVSSERVDSQPHPAVVRVLVDEGRLQASGTGSLVATRDQHGLVVTNWHVVREAKGPIQVVFPDGFRSEATLLKTDKDWDLAALLIWRPNAPPLVIGSTAPQAGESLTIAGYGQGDYRAVTGKCTQYVAPSVKHPYEILELSAEARQGDSGGPILNDRGELAGVLFGASRGTTSGSYCGRVRWFLSSVWPELATSNRHPPSENPLVGFRSEPVVAAETPLPADLVPIRPFEPAATAVAQESPAFEQAAIPEPPSSLPAISLPPLSTPSSHQAWDWDTIVGTSQWERMKSLLAAVGLLAIWGNLSRWITS